jgi:HAD superfamily hydrolase (TIGR01484 family)
MSAAKKNPESLESADLSRVEAVFTDVDGTLTTKTVIESATIRSLEKLRAAGIRVVLVSGRPAGWGECWVRTLPVNGVIVENGGLYFTRDPDGAIRKVYAQSPRERQKLRPKLMREVERAMQKVPGARLSSDSAYTEVNVAIDYNEEIRLGPEAADQLEQILGARGVTAVRSNVHVNCWIGTFDKMKTVERFLADEWGVKLRPRDGRYVYAGDSFNDAPMFERFELSVGVANVKDVLDQIEHAPAYITRQREGRGFRELVRSVLQAG